jgi:hypothetical protein
MNRPPASPRLLIVGHSHVLCLRMHLRTLQRPDVQILQLRTALGADLQFAARGMLRRELAPYLAGPPPQALCLSMAGNLHNRIGSVEHPQPFSIGFPDADCTSGAGRTFIPYQVIQHAMHHFLAGWLAMADAVYEQFPAAKRFYFNPPPPLLDWSQVEELPQQFEEMQNLGAAPQALRLQLYQMQTRIRRDYAGSRGAQFIDVPPAALDADGFLDRRYIDRDPTHANGRYGAVLFDHIMDSIRVPA